MAQGMSDLSAQFRPTQSDSVRSIESEMRDELVHADAMVGTIAPILRHLLANSEHSLFSDEILASMRGMLADVARQLLDARSGEGEGAAPGQHSSVEIQALIDGFAVQQGFLAHAHGLALEWQLTQRLQARLSLDPVLSPLLQALIASTEPPVAASAMALLAAQARFAQNQRRMHLPLGELPGDLLHAALVALRGTAGDDPEVAARIAAAEQRIRDSYNESRTRLGLISRLVLGMGGGAMAALSVTHAGVAIFLSALALGSGQDRDLATLATNESQVARLALALAAAGLKPQAIEEQFAAIHPEVTLPEGFEQLGADRAAALLARSVAMAGG